MATRAIVEWAEWGQHAVLGLVLTYFWSLVPYIIPYMILSPTRNDLRYRSRSKPISCDPKTNKIVSSKFCSIRLIVIFTFNLYSWNCFVEKLTMKWNVNKICAKALTFWKKKKWRRFHINPSRPFSSGPLASLNAFSAFYQHHLPLVSNVFITL